MNNEITTKIKSTTPVVAFLAMNNRLLPIIFLIVSCLILLTCVPIDVQAQDNPENGKKVFDTYATVVTMVYPPAGVAFKVAGEMLDMFGYFGNSKDLVGEAIKHINERLDILEKRVSDLEAKLREVQNEVFRTQNMARIRLLKAKHDALNLLLYKLQQKSPEKRDKLALAKEAEIIAGGFLDDPDLWMWSDLRENDGVMLQPDFKPLPALEYYVVALVAYVAAIDNATDGDYEFAKREYGPELQKHIAYLSVRPGWKEGDNPETLPENIKVRVSFTLVPLSRQSVNRVCRIGEWCEDKIGRVSRNIRTHEVIMPLNTDLCNVPPGMSAKGSEEELERMYGTEVMEKLAEKLTLLKMRGTVREQFIGTFGKTPPNYQPMWVYAIKNDGDLIWYRKDTGASPWQGPKKVGRGWADGFKDVIPAGGNSIYALTNDGIMMWYRHDGFNDGSFNWKGAVNVGHGWLFSKIFSGGDGIVYALQADGSLLWYRHGGYADGGGPDTWIGPRAVGSGWQNFKDIFSTGEGRVYAINPDGTLLLYQHIGYTTGERSWAKPRQVGTGWAGFRQVVPVGDGVILAIKDDGKLWWYKHFGMVRTTRVRFASLKEKWEGPVEIGSGFIGFQKVFALIPSSTPPIVR